MTTLRKLHDDKGMTIVEVMVALVILGLTFVALTSLVVTSTSGNVGARNIERATLLAQQKIEELRLLPTDHPWFVDTDGDGTDKDANANGIDDADEAVPPPDPLKNFGLDDTGVNADFTEMDADNIYTISWNVAMDVPAENMRTIRVIVAKSEFGVERGVHFDLMRIEKN